MLTYADVRSDTAKQLVGNAAAQAAANDAHQLPYSSAGRAYANVFSRMLTYADVC
jgi:hypothetical protein